MRLLLDAHLPHVLAEALRQQDIDALTLTEWHDGQYLSASDDLILVLAYEDGRVLVSCDCRTIPPLLTELTSTGQHHAGVVLVASRTFRPSDVGGLLGALSALAMLGERWEDRVFFLKRTLG